MASYGLDQQARNTSSGFSSPLPPSLKTTSLNALSVSLDMSLGSIKAPISNSIMPSGVAWLRICALSRARGKSSMLLHTAGGTTWTSPTCRSER